MVLKDKVFIGQAEIRVGQEKPVVVTNVGKNQLILIQKNYLSKWKILGFENGNYKVNVAVQIICQYN